MTVGVRHLHVYTSASGPLGIQGQEFPETFHWPPNLTLLYSDVHAVTLFFFASAPFSWSKLMTAGMRHASPCLRQCFRCFGYSRLGIS